MRVEEVDIKQLGRCVYTAHEVHQHIVWPENHAAIGKLSKPFEFKDKTQLMDNYLAEHKLTGDKAKEMAKEMRQ